MGTAVTTERFGVALLGVVFLVAMVVLNTLLSTGMSGPQMTVVGFEEQHAKAPDFVESGSASGELNRLQAAHLALQSRYDHLTARFTETQGQLERARAAAQGGDVTVAVGAATESSNRRASSTGSAAQRDLDLTALELPGFCLESSIPVLELDPTQRLGKGSRAECFAACTATAACVAWTHAVGKCTLRRVFVSPCKQYEAWRTCLARRRQKESGCHSGVVRTAPQRPTTTTDAALLDRLNVGGATETEPNARAVLDDVDLVTFGQCHQHSCLDVDHCAARYTGPTGRFGFVLTHDLRRPAGKRFTASHTYVQLQVMAKQVPADVIIMVPNDTVAQYPLTPDERARFASEGVKIHEVAWILPPKMRWTRKRMWCGFQDFIRLNSFGIPGYDALVSYDSDIFVRANMLSVFKCAAQNKLLITAGPNSPCNIGFVAFRPDPKLVEAAVFFAQGANFSMETGWDNAGWGPGRSKFTGGECGQGFYWTHFFYNGQARGTALAEESYRIAGIERPKGFQVDRCRYNYQRWGWWKEPWGWVGDESSDQCDFPGFECKKSVLAIHKPFDVRTHMLTPLKAKPESLRSDAALVKKTYGHPVRTQWAWNETRDYNSMSSWRCTDGWVSK